MASLNLAFRQHFLLPIKPVHEPPPNTPITYPHINFMRVNMRQYEMARLPLAQRADVSVVSYRQGVSSAREPKKIPYICIVICRLTNEENPHTSFASPSKTYVNKDGGSYLAIPCLCLANAWSAGAHLPLFLSPSLFPSFRRLTREETTSRWLQHMFTCFANRMHEVTAWSSCGVNNIKPCLRILLVRLRIQCARLAVVMISWLLFYAAPHTHAGDANVWDCVMTRCSGCATRYTQPRTHTLKRS